MYNSLAKNEHELTEQMSKTSQMSLNEQNLTKSEIPNKRKLIKQRQQNT